MPSKDQIFPYSDNPGQNPWYKMGYSSKTGQEKKSLVSVFACFLTAIPKVYVFEGRLGTRLRAHPNLRFF